MKNKAMRQRIAKSLGLKSLSEEEYAALDIKKALGERRAELKAAKNDKPIS